MCKSLAPLFNVVSSGGLGILLWLVNVCFGCVTCKAYCWATAVFVVYNTFMPALHGYLAAPDPSSSIFGGFFFGLEDWEIFLAGGAVKLALLYFALRTSNFIPNCSYFHCEVIAGVYPNNDQGHIRKLSYAQCGEMFDSMWRYGCMCWPFPVMIWGYMAVEIVIIFGFANAFDGDYANFGPSAIVSYIGFFTGIPNVIKALLFVVYGIFVYPVCLVGQCVADCVCCKFVADNFQCKGPCCAMCGVEGAKRGSEYMFEDGTTICCGGCGRHRMQIPLRTLLARVLQ